MKKFVLLCIITLCGGHLFSQSFSVGVVGGFANTDVSGIDPYDGDEDFYRLGVVLGGFVNYDFNHRASLQLELLYATKGSLQPADSSNDYLYDKLRLNYIEVPVLFKYKLHLIVNKEELDKLEVEAGPSYAQLLSSSHENNNGELQGDRPFNKNDFLINAGLNYYFSENFSLDLRFASSIVPIRPHANDVTYRYNKGEYNTTFNYTLRYTFR